MSAHSPKLRTFFNSCSLTPRLLYNSATLSSYSLKASTSSRLRFSAVIRRLDLNTKKKFGMD